MDPAEEDLSDGSIRELFALIEDGGGLASGSGTAVANVHHVAGRITKDEYLHAMANDFRIKDFLRRHRSLASLQQPRRRSMSGWAPVVVEVGTVMSVLCVPCVPGVLCA